MTEIEDQLRAYAAATARAQRPVEMGEVIARRRPKRRLLVGATAIFTAVVVIAAGIAALRGHRAPAKVVVAPTSSTPAKPGPADCPAASLVVTSTSGDLLVAGWLPPGWAPSTGDGSSQVLLRTYSAPGGEPRVELLRYHSTQPLSQLFLGTPHPTVVQGHPGIFSVATSPPAPYAALLWNPTPGVAIVVNGYKVPEADLRKIAENVHYTPGAPFTYPAHPHVTVTREQALAALGAANNDAHAALTSFGEVSAIVAGAKFGDIRAPLTPDAAVTQPVWVAWARSSDRPDLERAAVVDAQSGNTIATIAHIGPRPIDSLTDRSRPSCAPPLGVLTRSEATFLAHPLPRVTTILKLARQGSIDMLDHGEAFQCGVNSCDPSVPIWVVIQEARDQRFVNQISRPPGYPVPKVHNSFSVTMIDARTGPQDTNFGSELGGGRPPASLLSIADLSP